MRDLPAEIYTNIFWYAVAIQLSWEEVILRTRNISLMKFDFNNPYFTQYLKYSHLIKTLAFEDAKDHRCSDKFSRIELLELLDLSPNLEAIYFSVTNYLEEYLRYLLDAELQHIKRIDTGLNLRLLRSNLLFPVYYKFRNSISCIRLAYDRKPNNFESQLINILNSLTQFKQLTKLELHGKRDINYIAFGIPENFPDIERLEFFSDPISESAIRHILNDNRRINLNFISSLTHLDLLLPYLSATYTRHLVDYFPNQLTDLNLMIFPHRIDIVGMELALRLMEKAGSIDKTCIRFLQDEEGTRQTHCTARFNGEMVDLVSLGHSFRYNSLGRLFVTYALYLSNLQESITAEMTVPDKTSSIIGPEIFNVLEVNLLILYDGDECRTLNYSLSNCPRLQSLNFTYTTADSSNASFSLKHKEGLISSDQANCDFNVLQMEHTRPTKHFFDLVTTRLRNIEIVSVNTEDWSRKYCYYNDPVIDLTGFKKLISFKYTKFYHTITQLVQSTQVLVVVIFMGSGLKSFCAGLDLRFAREFLTSAEDAMSLNQPMYDAIDRLTKLPLITLGIAIGGSIGGGIRIDYSV
ncbi:hypothetical protein HPULCUR_006567 [Helicostylum pulchrum]|uniref:F-box domain-containing protein n=1 Tax=Helicostylum pulchrum TaxID=562976 RepID=A0ABP9Y3L2_9FUNG